MLSWHHVNGAEAAELLLAVLVTTRHPASFQEAHAPSAGEAPISSDAMLLIPLKAVCRTPQEMADLMQSLFTDIRVKSPLQKFKVVKEMRAGRGKALVYALILQPSVGGRNHRSKEGGVRHLWLVRV